MIVSKSNLLAVNVTRADSKVPMLDNVFIAADGSSCGSSGRSIIVISPVKEEVKTKLKAVLPDTGENDDIIISSDTAKEILKAMGSDKQYGGLLEHCRVKRRGDEEVEAILTDGKRKKTIVGRRYTRKYIPYQNVVRKAVDEAAKKGVRVVVNMKRLRHLLESIDKICPDSAGESPLFIEFGDNGEILIRAINFVNGQRIVAVMSSYQGIEGKWLDYDKWEKSFLNKERTDGYGMTKYVVKHKKK